MRASEIRRGEAVVIDGKLFVVTNADHNTPGNLRAKVQFKLRDVSKGTIMDKRVGATDDIEVVNLDRRPVEYLYSDNTGHILMDLETYDQQAIAAEVFGDDIRYLKPNTQFQASFHDGKMVSYELPKTVDLKITETMPAIKGAHRHQPAEGSHHGDRAEDPRPALHRNRRGCPDQHRNQRLS